MQLMNNEFNTFKMNDSTHVQMLIVQKIWKNSLIIHVWTWGIKLLCVFLIYKLISVVCNIWIGFQ
jgi:hypothetical protein